MAVDFLSLVILRLDDRRYALPMTVVERIVRAVEVTPLPGAPAIVLGAINVAGRLLPVLDLRRRLRLPEREIAAADWFVLATTRQRTVVLSVDESEGIVELPRADMLESERLTPGLTQFPGVTALDGNVLLIYDLDTFLSLGEAASLDLAIAHAGADANVDQL